MSSHAPMPPAGLRELRGRRTRGRTLALVLCVAVPVVGGITTIVVPWWVDGRAVAAAAVSAAAARWSDPTVEVLRVTRYGGCAVVDTDAGRRPADGGGVVVLKTGDRWHAVAFADGGPGGIGYFDGDDVSSADSCRALAGTESPSP